MRDDVKRALMLGVLAGVVGLSPGCATSATGQVQELEPGTYSVGISRTTSYLAEGEQGDRLPAVDKAGAHCHAKGQKFMLKSAVGKTVGVPLRADEPGSA